MGLTSIAIRAFSVARMPVYINLGFSSRMIRADLVERFGKAYRFQNIQADMRAFTGMGKLERLIKKLPRDVAVPKTRMIESELLYPAKYRVHARITVYNTETKISSEKRISFYDDENRGLDAWLDAWKDQFVDGLYDSSQVITGAEVVSIEHDKRFPY